MMFKKQLLIMTLFLGITLLAHAQNVELNDDHPEKYVVQKGDTLWDISAVFLKSPWLWPEIWYANPQVENPHLIYPGDELNLVYVDGKPQITVDRSHPTVKLGPEVRTIEHDQAVETIALTDIEPFLRELRILNKEDIDLAPYVVAAEEGRNVSATDNLIYVRGLKNLNKAII
jgi:hypothetical protein